MLNSGMERITDIGILISCFQEEEEETMVTRFHGLDRHRKNSTFWSLIETDARLGLCDDIIWGPISLSEVRKTRSPWRRPAAVSTELVTRCRRCSPMQPSTLALHGPLPPAN